MGFLFLFFMWCVGMLVASLFAIFFSATIASDLAVWFVVTLVFGAAAIGMASAGLERGGSENAFGLIVYPGIAALISYAMFPRE